MSHPRTISAKQLTILMTVLIVGPIAFGYWLFIASPKREEPSLKVQLRFASEWVGEGSNEPRLVPCIILQNQSDGTIGKLSVGLNNQFYSTGNAELSAQQEITIPLETFIARTGSVRFPVGSRNVETVTVFGQLPDGARGISEFSIPPKSATNREEWIAPLPSNRRQKK